MVLLHLSFPLLKRSRPGLPEVVLGLQSSLLTSEHMHWEGLLGAKWETGLHVTWRNPLPLMSTLPLPRPLIRSLLALPACSVCGGHCVDTRGGHGYRRGRQPHKRDAGIIMACSGCWWLWNPKALMFPRFTKLFWKKLMVTELRQKKESHLVCTQSLCFFSLKFYFDISI